MNVSQKIEQFLKGSFFAVVGASNNRSKFGNRVLRFYQRLGLEVVPVNPNADVIEGLASVDCLSNLSTLPHGVSIITPRNVTEQIVDELVTLGIKNVWMQPGAESSHSIDVCESAGINLLHSGPCILVDVPS